MPTTAGLAFAATLCTAAGAALAQTPTTTPVPSATATLGPSVSGITVSPLTHKPCAPKDKDCIALVVAQVKALYPEQLKAFCYQQKMDVMQRDMQANNAGWCDNPKLGAAAICNHYVPPVVKQVCASDPPAATK